MRNVNPKKSSARAKNTTSHGSSSRGSISKQADFGASYDVPGRDARKPFGVRGDDSRFTTDDGGYYSRRESGRDGRYMDRPDQRDQRDWQDDDSVTGGRRFQEFDTRRDVGQRSSPYRSSEEAYQADNSQWDRSQYGEDYEDQDPVRGNTRDTQYASNDSDLDADDIEGQYDEDYRDRQSYVRRMSQQGNRQGRNTYRR